MPGAIDLQPVLEVDLGQPIGQLRAAPVRLKGDAQKAFLIAYAADFDVDPYVEMFFFPTDTLKLALVLDTGEILWTRDLGRGVVPGIWFCPVLPFDLDGDGQDEIWFVNNPNEQHPLGLNSYTLQRLDAATGEPTGSWPWRHVGNGQNLSHTFRNFIIGANSGGEPVLITAQGTYGDMHFQAWNPDMSPRWVKTVAADEPGARGSHMCPVTDLDSDGIDELMWGERSLRLSDGEELFCADRDTWHAHSDVIQPVLRAGTRDWFLYTCREGDQDVPPRVALYDATGNRLWGDLDHGHIDMGWVAKLGEGGDPVASAIRIGHKTCGPDGRFHQDLEEFTYNVFTGEPVELPFSVYRTLPVDVNGDGLHELIRGRASGDGEVLDREGNVIASVGGAAALLCKFMDLPGEQILSYHAAGMVRVWADCSAEDSPAAVDRYASHFYQSNMKLSAVGYNLNVLGGI